MEQIMAMETKGKFLKNFIFLSVTVFLAAAVLLSVVLIRDDFIQKDYSGLRKQMAKHFLLNELISERDRTKIRARAMQLTFYEPAFGDLIQMIKDPAHIDPNKLDVYKNYYEKVAKSFPEIAEVQGMLGFIYYHLGDMEKAKAFYRRAIQLNPQMFWFHYNFGVIFFKNGEFEKAAVLFKQALGVNFTLNLKMINSSSVYQQIFWPNQNWGGYSIENSLKEGILKCEQMIKASQEFIDNLRKTKVQVTQDEQIYSKLF